MSKQDEAKMEFQKAVMRRKDENQEENMATKQKDIEEPAGKVAHSTKTDKALKQTPRSSRRKAHKSDEEKGAQETSEESQSCTPG